METKKYKALTSWVDLEDQSDYAWIWFEAGRLFFQTEEEAKAFIIERGLPHHYYHEWMDIMGYQQTNEHRFA